MTGAWWGRGGVLRGEQCDGRWSREGSTNHSEGAWSGRGRTPGGRQIGCTKVAPPFVLRQKPQAIYLCSPKSWNRGPQQTLPTNEE